MGGVVDLLLKGVEAVERRKQACVWLAAYTST